MFWYILGTDYKWAANQAGILTSILKALNRILLIHSLRGQMVHILMYIYHKQCKCKYKCANGQFQCLSWYILGTDYEWVVNRATILTSNRSSILDRILWCTIGKVQCLSRISWRLCLALLVFITFDIQFRKLLWDLCVFLSWGPQLEGLSIIMFLIPRIDIVFSWTRKYIFRRQIKLLFEDVLGAYHGFDQTMHVDVIVKYKNYNLSIIWL